MPSTSFIRVACNGFDLVPQPFATAQYTRSTPPRRPMGSEELSIEIDWGEMGIDFEFIIRGDETKGVRLLSEVSCFHTFLNVIAFCVEKRTVWLKSDRVCLLAGRDHEHPMISSGDQLLLRTYEVLGGSETSRKQHSPITIYARETLAETTPFLNALFNLRLPEEVSIRFSNSDPAPAPLCVTCPTALERLTSVTTLSLNRLSLDSDQCRRITLNNVDRIYWSRVALEDESLLRRFSANMLVNMKPSVIDFEQCWFPKDQLKDLVVAIGDYGKLRHLRLASMRLKDEEILPKLAEAIRRNHHLHSLDITNNQLTDADFDMITGCCLYLKELRELILVETLPILNDRVGSHPTWIRTRNALKLAAQNTSVTEIRAHRSEWDDTIAHNLHRQLECNKSRRHGHALAMESNPRLRMAVLAKGLAALKGRPHLAFILIQQLSEHVGQSAADRSNLEEKDCDDGDSKMPAAA